MITTTTVRLTLTHDQVRALKAVKQRTSFDLPYTVSSYEIQDQTEESATVLVHLNVRTQIAQLKRVLVMDLNGVLKGGGAA
ncbi:MAG: hypothetical protein GY906_11400 [bacterium]|nr:hypothetical protein [bacterium]